MLTPRRRAGSNCSSCGKSPEGLAGLPSPFAEVWAAWGMVWVPSHHSQPSGPRNPQWYPGELVLFGHQHIQICCPHHPPAPGIRHPACGAAVHTRAVPSQHPPSGQEATSPRPAVAHLSQQRGRWVTEPLGQLELGMGLDSRGVALRQCLGRHGGGNSGNVYAPVAAKICFPPRPLRWG